MKANETAPSLIVGRRIRLRELEESDLGLIANWRNQPRALQWFLSSQRIDAEKQIQWFARYRERPDERMWVVETADGRPVGTIALCRIDVANRCAELGRVLIGEEDCLRLGYAKEATCRLILYAFRELGCDRISLEVLAGNEAAICLYESCGFRSERAIRNVASKDGASKDVLTMVILRGEWLAAKDAQCSIPTDCGQTS